MDQWFLVWIKHELWVRAEKESQQQESWNPAQSSSVTHPQNHIDIFLFCLSMFPLFVSSGGLSLWLILWLVVVKPGGVSPCPRLCVCYPTPMTVSCQSQNLTMVPAGVPYDSQRVFLQNNRITELRADSFGFETQVRITLLPAFNALKSTLFV